MKISLRTAVIPEGKKVLTIETRNYVHYLRRKGMWLRWRKIDRRAR